LVYSEGIWILALLSAVVLIVFGGITDRLIPLFAVGAFLAFTMSQAGMVAHWRRKGGKDARRSMAINGLGAIATGITLTIVLAAKFTGGAWVVVLAVPLLLGVMLGTGRHYARVERQTAPKSRFLTSHIKPPIVVVPVERWSSTAQNALRLALSISNDVQIVHVDYDGEDPLRTEWTTEVRRVARDAGLPVPKLVRLHSPYRFVIQPIIEHVRALEQQHKTREIAVVIPRLVEPRWYHYFLHNQRSQLLSGLLLLKGDRRIAIVDVPWRLE
jgi:hypothetical protein